MCEKLLDEDSNTLDNKVDFGVDVFDLQNIKNEKIQINFNTKSHEHLMKPNKEINLTEEEIAKKLKNFKNKEDKYVHEGFKGFGR